MHQIGRAQPPTGDQDRNADNSLKRRLQWWNASASALRKKLTPPAAAGLARCGVERRRTSASMLSGEKSDEGPYRDTRPAYLESCRCSGMPDVHVGRRRHTDLR